MSPGRVRVSSHFEREGRRHPNPHHPHPSRTAWECDRSSHMSDRPTARFVRPCRPPAPHECLEVVQEYGDVVGLANAQRDRVAKERPVLVRSLGTHANLRHEAKEHVAEMRAGGIEPATVRRGTLRLPGRCVVGRTRGDWPARTSGVYRRRTQNARSLDRYDSVTRVRTASRVDLADSGSRVLIRY